MKGRPCPTSAAVAYKWQQGKGKADNGNTTRLGDHGRGYRTCPVRIAGMIAATRYQPEDKAVGCGGAGHNPSQRTAAAGGAQDEGRGLGDGKLLVRGKPEI